ncbi:hypothetical protein SPRG_20682 [Saprolegnia parasitica CBS 223.65]|uniref:CCHC-type domain-containing protein n=1 Tax=Saprolegnia parasitica (strain CBS 223.65) TaxID=695850 RepID=A0A067C4W5_SAPPC|nr:hypothetical protein SPRG_20682 [Saprolegnia parasitica CBS 223.65]KDO25563.1 hypothetical protein SPRG_20682 [Saprolegnia parasitica CBS 223.65]|eukprot:XP_012203782.1 hypothetical protein SPRG_20682 [Saprolegnia parasitica CBS 223.65]
MNEPETAVAAYAALTKTERAAEPGKRALAKMWALLAEPDHWAVAQKSLAHAQGFPMAQKTSGPVVYTNIPHRNQCATILMAIAGTAWQTAFPRKTAEDAYVEFDCRSTAFIARKARTDAGLQRGPQDDDLEAFVPSPTTMAMMTMADQHKSWMSSAEVLRTFERMQLKEHERKTETPTPQPVPEPPTPQLLPAPKEGAPLTPPEAGDPEWAVTLRSISRALEGLVARAENPPPVQKTTSPTSPKSSLAAFRLSKVPTFIHKEDDKLAPAVHVRSVEGMALHGHGSVAMRVTMFIDALGSKERAWVFHLMSTKKFVPATMTEKNWGTLVDAFYTEYIGDKTYRESMYEKVTQKDNERFTEYVMRVALWAAVAGQQTDEERKMRIVVQGVVDRQLHAALWQISEDSLSWDEFEHKAKRLMASADAHARKAKNTRSKSYRVAQATVPTDENLQVTAARTGGPPSHGNQMPAATPAPSPAPSTPGRTGQGCHVCGEPGHYRQNCPQAQHLASCDFHGAHIGHTSDDCYVLKNARRYAETMTRAQTAQSTDDMAGTSSPEATTPTPTPVFREDRA